MKKIRLFWLCVITLSILFNFWSFINLMNQPTYKLGVLIRDVEVADFSDNRKILFQLPKGMTVINASPRGIASAGLFGKDRFTFTVIENSSNLIDYSSSNAISPHRALYTGSSSK